ncbi:MAG: ABC transporter ATP-binding protein [Frankiaceae bacterium]|nr:ABC transporter ATP-binding protein [Frankiaceae bacterium]
MRPPESVLHTSGLCKKYGATAALVDVNLALSAGEVLGFLGPNGAGKTTMLRVLMGSLRPTDGRAVVLGHDPWVDASALHADVGYLPGDLRMPLRFTGREVFELYGRLRGSTAVSHGNALVERLDVRVDVPIRAMSKGNRQKLGIVQAFMHRPRLLLLDEPTSGLDPLAQETFDELLRELVSDGTTVLLSSHVLAEVDRVADRVAMLRRGRLVAVERLEDLRRAAPHRVRARFRDGRPVEALRRIAGVRDVQERTGGVAFTATAGCLDAVVKALAAATLTDISIEPADLEDLFLSYYQGAGT